MGRVAILSSIVNGAYGLRIGVVIRPFSIKLGNCGERSGGIIGHVTVGALLFTLVADLCQ